MSRPILQCDALTVRFGARQIVGGATLALRPGEFTILVGPNGAGKTTLMRALAGLIPHEGTVTLAGRRLQDHPAQERARQLAYLPQGNVFHWPISVAATIALGRYPHGDPFSTRTDEDRIAVEQAMQATETQALAQRPVTELSGGERARVALARALATQAHVILADEPIVSLDVRHQLTVMALLQQAARGGGAVLAVIHDLMLAARFADRVLVMHKGRIVAEGPPAQTLSTANLAEIFGVETSVADIDGILLPIPLRPL